MTQIVIFGTTEARLEDSRWTCRNPALLAQLEDLRKEIAPTLGGEVPDPDWELAHRTVERMGRGVHLSLPREAEGPPERVY